ncbi:MAG: hypothetical protein R3Y10_13270 [Ferrimonas sp.]
MNRLAITAPISSIGLLSCVQDLPALVRQNGLTNLALVSLTADSFSATEAAALTSQLACECQQVLGATLLVDLCQPAEQPWHFTEISAHTEIVQQESMARLWAPVRGQQLDCHQVSEAMLRWHQEYPQVLLHCGSLDSSHVWMAAQGCQALLLCVRAGIDTEPRLLEALWQCQQRHIIVVGIFLEQSQLPALGQRVWACLQRSWPWRLPATWQHYCQRSCWLNPANR